MKESNTKKDFFRHVPILYTLYVSWSQLKDTKLSTHYGAMIYAKKCFENEKELLKIISVSPEHKANTQYYKSLGTDIDF